MSEFDWSAEAERQWNERASNWNANSKEMWETGSRKDIVSFFKSVVPLGAKVCDFGCGDGYGSMKLVRAGYHITGIDVSKEMILKAKGLADGTGAEFMKGDISKVDFNENAFDAVIAINSLEWTEDPLGVMKEIKRVVKVGGYACIGILGPTSMPRTSSFRRLYGEKVICNTMMPWELEKLAEENGWKKSAELGVYKRGVENKIVGSMPLDLRQAVSFMWLFIFENLK